MPISSTKIGKMVIEGFDSDYVFQTISKTNNYYEYEILNSWNKYLDNAKVIFDVGANLGNHTIYWWEKLSPDVIYSFEPYLPSFERLKSNIEKNGIKSVRTINKGVGERKGRASVQSFDDSNYGATSLKYEDELSSGTIEIIDLDSFVGENNINSVDFIKIDVEGFELSVIKGMEKILDRHKPDLWIEVGTETFKQIFDILIPLGYVISDIEGFNVLLLNECRHDKIDEVDYYKVLNAMFYNLNRTNIYYKNYITSKQWLEVRNEALNKKIKENDEIKSNYVGLKDKYDIELKQLNEKNQILQKQYEEEKGLHINDLTEYYQELKNEEELIKSLKSSIQKLEVQNSYLKAENSEYKRKLSKITDTWLGKIGLKAYRLLKRCKNKLKR